MDKALSRLLYILITSIILSACSSFNAHFNNLLHPNENNGVMDQNSKEVAGKFETSMDSIDKSKLSHALDKGLGVSTEWDNALTGVHYKVVPTKKLTINGNAFCRKYDITTQKGDKTDQFVGIACIGQDAMWHPVR